MSTYIKKFTAVVLVAFLFSTNSIFVYAFETNLWADRQKHIGNRELYASLPSLPTLSGQQFLAVSQPTLPSTNLNRFTKENPSLHEVISVLSEKYGTLRHIVKPSLSASDKVVLHIQDVHLNDEAQQNMAATLQDLFSKNKVGLLALEGTSGFVPLERYQTFPDPAIVKNVATYLLKEHKISGPVYAALTVGRGVPPVVGIDEPILYQKNVQAYRDSTLLYKKVRSLLDESKKQVNAEKRSGLNPSLLALDEKVQLYQSGGSGLGDYVEFLSKVNSSVPTDVATFLKALRTEKTLPFRQIESQRTALVEALMKTLGGEEIKDLVNKGVACRLGDLSPAQFYRYLKNVCESKNIDWKKYPSMEQYISYVLLADEIDPDRLLKAVQGMEDQAYASLIITSKEKQLISSSRSLQLAGKLVEFGLTPEEWQRYKQSRDSREPALSAQAVAELRTFEAFYEAAEARDQAMVENLRKEMDKAKGLVVLVTGGFHRPGIESRLKKAGVTTLEFVPKLTKVESGDGISYLSVFTQEKTPLEKLVAGEKLFTAPDPAQMQMGPPLAALATEGRDPAHQVPDEETRNILKRLGADDAIAAGATSHDLPGNRAELDIPGGAVVASFLPDQERNIDRVVGYPKFSWRAAWSSLKQGEEKAVGLLVPFREWRHNTMGRLVGSMEATPDYRGGSVTRWMDTAWKDLLYLLADAPVELIFGGVFLAFSLTGFHQAMGSATYLIAFGWGMGGTMASLVSFVFFRSGTYYARHDWNEIWAISRGKVIYPRWSTGHSSTAEIAQLRDSIEQLLKRATENGFQKYATDNLPKLQEVIKRQDELKSKKSKAGGLTPAEQSELLADDEYELLGNNIVFIETDLVVLDPFFKPLKQLLEDAAAYAPTSPGVALVNIQRAKEMMKEFKSWLKKQKPVRLSGAPVYGVRGAIRMRGSLSSPVSSSAPEGDYKKIVPLPLLETWDPEDGVLVQGFRKLEDKLKTATAHVPPQIITAEKTTLQVLDGLAYVKKQLQENIDANKTLSTASISIEKVHSDLRKVLGLIEQNPTQALSEIKSLNPVVDGVFRSFSDDFQWILSRETRSLTVSTDGEIMSGLLDVRDALTDLMPTVVTPHEEEVVSGEPEWQQVETVRGSGMAAVDRGGNRIVGPTSEVAGKFLADLSTVKTSNENYWPNEVVSLTVIRPELADTTVSIIVRGPTGVEADKADVKLNSHGVAVLPILDGSKRRLRTGEYKVLVQKGSNQLGETSFQVEEGSLGAVGFATIPKSEQTYRGQSDRWGNRWSYDSTKPNGVVLKNFHVTVHGLPYTGKVSVVVECEYCGHGHNALMGHKDLILNVVEGRITPPDNLPVSPGVDGSLDQSRVGDSIIGAHVDPETGVRSYELNVSAHTGRFIVRVKVPGEDGEAVHAIPFSHAADRRTVRIGKGGGYTYEVTNAPTGGMTEVPGRHVHVGLVKDQFSAKDPIHIRNRETAKGLPVPGIITDEKGQVQLDVKKGVKGVKFYLDVPQPNGKFETLELKNMKGKFGQNEKIAVSVPRTFYNHLRWAGFDESTGEYFEASYPIITPTSVNIKVETGASGTRGENQDIDVFATDETGAPLEGVSVIVQVYDMRTPAIDPTIPLSTNQVKGIEAGATTIYQQRDTTGATQHLRKIKAGGAMVSLTTPRPAGFLGGAVRTRGAIRARGALSSSRQRPAEEELPEPEEEQPMDVIKIAEEEDQEPVYVDAASAVSTSEPTRRNVLHVVGVTDKNGRVKVSGKLGGQFGRYAVVAWAVTKDKKTGAVDFTKQKEQYISATESIAINVAVPELLMPNAQLRPTASVRLNKKGNYKLKVHGAGIDSPIEETVNKENPKISFDLKGGVEGELVFELFDDAGTLVKKQNVSLRKPTETSLPLSRLEFAGAGERTVALEEGETMIVHRGVGNLLHGIVKNILGLTQGWYPHAGSQAAKIAIKVQLAAAIKLGVISGEGEDDNILRMIDADVVDLHSRFYDAPNGLFRLHPEMETSVNATVLVVRSLVHARRILETAPSAMRRNLSTSISLINQMIKGVEGAANARGIDLKEKAGYDPETGEDVLTVTDASGVKTTSGVGATLVADLKKAMQETGITTERPVDEAVSAHQLEELAKRIGDLPEQIQFARAAFLMEDWATFQTLFDRISRRMAYSKETGMTHGPGEESLVQVHSNSAVGLAFLELLVMMAMLERGKVSGASSLGSVRFRGESHPLVSTVYLPVSGTPDVERTESVTLPPQSVAEVTSLTTVGFDDFRNGPDLADVTVAQSRIQQGGQTQVTLQLKVPHPEEYFIDVILPSNVSLNRVIPSYENPYGKLLYGYINRGGNLVHSITLPLTHTNGGAITFVVNSNTIGKSGGLILLRHVEDPSKIKTLEIPSIEVTADNPGSAGIRIRAHSDLVGLLPWFNPVGRIYQKLLDLIRQEEESHLNVAHKLGLGDINHSFSAGFVDATVQTRGQALRLLLAGSLHSFGKAFRHAVRLVPFVIAHIVLNGFSIDMAHQPVLFALIWTTGLLVAGLPALFWTAVGFLGALTDWINIFGLRNLKFPTSSSSTGTEEPKFAGNKFSPTNLDRLANVIADALLSSEDGAVDAPRVAQLLQIAPVGVEGIDRKGTVGFFGLPQDQKAIVVQKVTARINAVKFRTPKTLAQARRAVVEVHGGKFVPLQNKIGDSNLALDLNIATTEDIDHALVTIKKALSEMSNDATLVLPAPMDPALQTAFEDQMGANKNRITFVSSQEGGFFRDKEGRKQVFNTTAFLFAIDRLYTTGKTNHRRTFIATQGECDELDPQLLLQFQQSGVLANVLLFVEWLQGILAFEPDQNMHIGDIDKLARPATIAA